jgi:hypothetical protein
MAGNHRERTKPLLKDEVWAVANHLRDRGHHLTLGAVISELRARDLSVSYQDVLDLGPLLQMHNDWIVPRSLLDFIDEYVAAIKPEAVFDPCARWGAVLLSFAKYKPLRRVGYVQNQEELNVAQYLDGEKAVAWELADPLIVKHALGAPFDLVVSCPPWGTRSLVPQIAVADVTVSDDFGSMALASAASQLKPSGKILAVMNAGAIQARPQSFFMQLPLLGLSIEALIHFPNGYFANAAIDGYIMMLQKRESNGKFFIGEISNDGEHNSRLLQNILAKRPAKEMSLGQLFEGGAFPGYRQFAALEARAAQASRMGLTSTPLAETILEINLTKRDDVADFPDRENAIFLPLIGPSNASASTQNLKLKAHNYAQIVFKPHLAFAPYMAEYFNSGIGRLSRETMQTGTYIPKITKTSISASSVYIPSLEEQIRCVEVDTLAASLLAEIGEIRGSLWRAPRQSRSVREALQKVNREDTFDAWLDTLPFPLASILWAYHASGDDNKARYERLIQFFEAFVEFVALLFWSVARGKPNLATDVRYPFGTGMPVKSSVKISSFGTWLEIASRLSKFYRTLLNGKPDERSVIVSAFGVVNSLSPLEMLFSSRIIEVCQAVNELRNNLVGHTGIVGEEDARRRRALLEPHLADIRAAIGTKWSELPLYRAGNAKIRGDLREYEAERVMGRAFPFEKIRFESLVDIDTGSLFLAAEDSKVPIRLAPLVVIAPSPRSAQNACYFYNRLDGSKMRFISYHFENDAERFEADPTVMETLTELVTLTSAGGQ